MAPFIQSSLLLQLRLHDVACGPLERSRGLGPGRNKLLELGGAFKALKNIKQDPLKPNKGKYKMTQSPT